MLGLGCQCGTFARLRGFSESKRATQSCDVGSRPWHEFDGSACAALGCNLMHSTPTVERAELQRYLPPVKNRLAYTGLVLRGSFLVCIIATTSGCGQRIERRSSEAELALSSAATRVAPVASTQMVAPIPAAVASKPGEGAAEESCGVDHSAKIRDSGERVVKDPKTGKEITQVGQAFDAGVRPTKLNALLADPQPFVGKSVKVEGDVVAMCSHRRGWFAVVDETSKSPLRVVAVPNFLVPANAMGRHAKAVGVLDVQEVSERAMKHLARDHGLPEARQIVTLRATGAEFY